MPETDKVFAGSIPEDYDRYLVPLIFESFARDIAQRAAALSPRSVLETAAGSGVVTRALTPRLSPDALHRFPGLSAVGQARPSQGRGRSQRRSSGRAPQQSCAGARRTDEGRVRTILPS